MQMNMTFQEKKSLAMWANGFWIPIQPQQILVALASGQVVIHNTVLINRFIHIFVEFVI
jgi:hypothetical protein